MWLFVHLIACHVLIPHSATYANRDILVLLMASVYHAYHRVNFALKIIIIFVWIVEWVSTVVSLKFVLDVHQTVYNVQHLDAKFVKLAIFSISN